MVRRFIPTSLLIATLATLAACADSPTAPKNDCIVVQGVVTCWP